MGTSSGLHGRVALVTGVSRPEGIGLAVADRLHTLGAAVFATGWPPADVETPWGGRAIAGAELGSGREGFPIDRHDLGEPDAPAELIAEVIERHGAIDIVVAAHAWSPSGSLADVSAAQLDRCFAVNARSVVLLARHLATRHVPSPPAEPPRGRMIWFTSGQHLGPMDGEIAYAVSKGALHQMTASLDHALAAHRIVANCVNPGPVDTGYAPPDVLEAVAARFPDGRWPTPADVADLVAFLAGDGGAAIRGQVLDAESGFRRFG